MYSGNKILGEVVIHKCPEDNRVLDTEKIKVGPRIMISCTRLPDRNGKLIPMNIDSEMGEAKSIGDWRPILERARQEGLWPPEGPVLCHACPLTTPQDILARLARWILDIRFELALSRQKVWPWLRRFLPRL